MTRRCLTLLTPPSRFADDDHPDERRSCDANDDGDDDDGRRPVWKSESSGIARAGSGDGYQRFDDQPTCLSFGAERILNGTLITGKKEFPQIFIMSQIKKLIL
jgi:hypothetical protein